MEPGRRNGEYGDNVRLELWDEDVFVDDLVGTVAWEKLPASGFYQTSNRMAVLEVLVDATDLPAGYRYNGPPMGNAFLRPADFDSSALREIVESAHRMEARTEILSTIARIAVYEAFAWVVLPRATLLQHLAVGTVADMTVLDQFFGRT